MTNWKLSPLLIACVVATVLRTAASATDKESLDLEKIKDEFAKKHPEIVKWFERAKLRLETQPNATEQDINEFRTLLKDAQKSIYDYVTSPNFNITVMFLTEKAVEVAEPFLGILPIQELRKLFTLVNNDPHLIEMMAEANQQLQKMTKNGNAEIQGIMTGLASEIFQDALKTINKPQHGDKGFIKSK